jgi:hypothetical protein
MTPSGIDPATFRFVAQFLNHCATACKDILKGQNIIGFIRNQRLNWLGHVEPMTEDNIVQKIKIWKPMSKRPIGRNILGGIRSMNVNNWKK